MNISRWTIAGLLIPLVGIAAGGCAGLQSPAPHMAAAGPAPLNRPAADRPAPPKEPSDRGGELHVRGQNTATVPRPIDSPVNTEAPGSGDHWRYPLTASGSQPRSAPSAWLSQAQPPAAAPLPGVLPPPGPGGPGQIPGGPPGAPGPQPFIAPPEGVPPGEELVLPETMVPLDIFVEETRTGRLMFGVGVNSDAGMTGQVVVDERNFDITRFPTSVDDVLNGTAWRGAGQGFRLEAMPGTLVQRYLVSFTEPYLMGTQVSLNTSGYFFDRRFLDWDEQRLGGRLGLGYRLTPDLSFTSALRMENVTIHRPRVLGVPELDAVLGQSDLYSGRFTLTHDTRDIPFAPTEGHLFEVSYEQVFGSFDYPRGDLDYRRYFLIRERPDGSGRHTLSFTGQLGFSGAQTPVFENYFAGGFSTLRGFQFRGASPTTAGVMVGGPFRALGSVEYMFPLTADDMLRGVVFCDFGTVERRVEINPDSFRVAPGVGLRIAIPALGPAPLALDFAVPVARDPNDRIQNFSFFFGFGRG